jgi:hypothetical protein
MNNKITDHPIVTSLLRHIAEERGRNDPLGELSRELLKGETAPADLLRSSWYGEGLAAAAERGQAELSRMAPEQIAKLEESATRLHGVHPAIGRDE